MAGRGGAIANPAERSPKVCFRAALENVETDLIKTLLVDHLHVAPSLLLRGDEAAAVYRGMHEESHLMQYIYHRLSETFAVCFLNVLDLHF